MRPVRTVKEGIMRYRNVKNGDVIESACVISGSNWELVKEDAAAPHPEESNAADAPEQKPKSARRSKKP